VIIIATPGLRLEHLEPSIDLQQVLPDPAVDFVRRHEDDLVRIGLKKLDPYDEGFEVQHMVDRESGHKIVPVDQCLDHLPAQL
jgi:hypothetical protein